MINDGTISRIVWDGLDPHKYPGDPLSHLQQQSIVFNSDGSVMTAIISASPNRAIGLLKNKDLICE